MNSGPYAASTIKPLSQAAKSAERASVFSAAVAGSAAHARVPTQEGEDDVDESGPPVGVLDRRHGENAKVAWAEEGDLCTGDDMDGEYEVDDEEDDFLATKNAIEQIMEIKVLQRKEVQGRFMKDLAQLLIYGLFLVLFSINQWHNPNTYKVYNVKSVIHKSFTDGAPYPLSNVNSIRGIYDFLELSVVPAVAVENMTELDARCTTDGRHKNVQCLTNPFAAEELCCYTQQPNQGLFASGGRSKNILMTPVKIRQQRVMPQVVKTPVGELVRWPVLTAKTEETRNGGGTLLSQDPDGWRLDWPSGASWYTYQTCIGQAACTVDDRLGDRKIYINRPEYSQSGYVAVLTGTAQNMIQEISNMKKFRFLGGSTRAVFVDFTAYFPGESLYSTVSILFEIGSANVFVSPSISVRVSDLRQASDQQFWRIIDYVVFLFAFLLLMIDVYKFLQGPTEFVQDPWNYVSLINYGMFLYCGILLFQLDYTLQQAPPVGIQGLGPMTDASSSLNWMYWMLKMDKYYDIASGNCIPSWMRLIRYLEQMSPSYKQVIKTITASSNDLLTFMVLMMILVMGFAQAFNLQFGLQIREYSSLTMSLMTLFRTVLGDFDYPSLDQASPYMATIYFLMFFFLVILMMINMCLGIIIKTYDAVAAQLAEKAKTEVTGWSMLLQNLAALIKMTSARTLDDLKRISPEANQSMSQLYIDRQDMFQREYLTETEFRILFGGDEDALHRMGVNSVEELVMCADATGKPHLDMQEVTSYMASLNQVAGKKKSKKQNFVSKSKKFAPAQLSQMRQTMEGSMQQALAENVRMLKAFIQNQLAQATLVLSGSSGAVETSTNSFGVGNAPGGSMENRGMSLRSSPELRTGTRVEGGKRGGS